jgi:signal transduction histidine kinase
MKHESDYQTSGEAPLRDAIDDITSQLCVTVDGRFDFAVKTSVVDETVDKLAMLVNFVVEASRRALADLQERNVKLAELDRMKSTLLANVSHELRTPLALILGPTEKWLARGPLTDEQRRDLEVVTNNARSLLKTVNDLLDVSRLEAGKLTPKYVRTDLARLVRLTCSLFDGVAREREVSFSVSAPPSLPVEVDREMVERVLLNLLSNAFKFGPVAGRIACAASVRDDAALLEVQDNGPGIPQEMRERVYERFVQLESGSARRYGGTGLGLSIVKEFVELLHGTIEVTDPPGGGTRFAVSLPRRAPLGVPVANESGKVAPRSTTHAEELGGSTGKTGVVGAALAEHGVVLVVEDNPEMNRFISDALRDEYAVVRAFDGHAGVEAAIEHRPDIVLSDVMMPRMSGDEMLAELRRRPELDATRVVFLTAKADERLRVRLLREGADDYLTKPFSADELLVRVRNLMSAKKARDLLQRELSSSKEDLAELAQEVSLRRHELERALEDARVARGDAERLLLLRDEFISVAAHELRTPLTPLNIQRQLIQRIMTDKNVAEVTKEKKLHAYFEMSKRQVQTMTNLVDNLLDLSRLRLGGFAINPAPDVDLAALVSEVVERQRPHWEQAGSPVEVEVIGSPRGRWDRARLDQVFSNILGNAIKYGKSQPIQVRVSCDEAGARIAIQDHGVGIPPEHQARIFNRFERASSIESFGGLGLGLYIARQIIDAHGGTILVESAPSEGSTFAVVLPLAPPEAPSQVAAA